MNKNRFSFFIACAALVLAAGSLQAQTSFQRLTFSLLAEYQTNIFSAGASAGLTNEDSLIRTVLITAGNVVKAISVDLGTNVPSVTNWYGSQLVREVNLTNGAEGIFLRKEGLQTNVSSFFSFSNNFTAGLSNVFPGATNNISGLTNNINGSTNSTNAQFTLNHGWLRMTGPTNTTTNYVTTAGLYFISLNTTNLKFNLVGVGNGAVTNVTGRIDGTLYERAVHWQTLGTAGSFYLNVTTNIFDTGTNPPAYFTGPVHGSFNTTAPYFSAIAGP